jgi:uracil-DNA glycosylase
MNVADRTELALLHEVYDCKSCADEGPNFAGEFTLAPSGSFFKFPPLIGGTGKVKLLFVGYNPRRTSNLRIHDFAMGSFPDFCKLSNNVDHHGRRYVGSLATALDHEVHYELHDEIVQRVFGKPFEQVAAVTEMYLCASKNGKKLNTERSPCAQKFLMRTISIASPDYIVTFGSGLPRFFNRFIRGVKADVLHLPFPAGQVTPPATMRAAVDWAVATLIALEAGMQPPQKTWKWRQSDAKLPQGIVKY